MLNEDHLPNKVPTVGSFVPSRIDIGFRHQQSQSRTWKQMDEIVVIGGPNSAGNTTAAQLSIRARRARNSSIRKCC